MQYSERPVIVVNARDEEETKGSHDGPPKDIITPLLLSSRTKASLVTAALLRRDDATDFSEHFKTVGVHDSESAKSGTLLEGLDEQRSSRFEFDFGTLELRKFRRVVDLGSSSLLGLLPQDLGHLAGNLGGTREDNRTVSGLEDTRVLLNSDQGSEALDRLKFSFLFKVDDVTRVDLLILGDTLDGKTNRVSRSGRVKNLLVLFDGENLLSLEVGGDESDNISRSEGSLFDGSTDDLTNTLDVVDVGDRQTKRGIRFTLRRLDEVVEGINNGVSCDQSLGVEVGRPSLVPRALGWVNRLDQVVSVESRVRDERNFLGLESNQLDHLDELILDFVVSVFGPSAGVHLVDSDKNLFDTKEVQETGMLTSLSFFHSKLGVGLGNSGFETTLLGRHQQHAYISGGGTGDHVLDVILVTRGIDDSVMVLLGEELLGVTLDGNTTLAFFLASIKVVSETERTLTLFFGKGLQLGHLTLGDSTHLENQMTASGRLSGIDVTADDKGQMLFIRHLERLESSCVKANKRRERNGRAILQTSQTISNCFVCGDCERREACVCESVCGLQ